MKGEKLPKVIWTKESIFPQEVAAKTLPSRQY
jgi:hypothetical protein